jgi:tRNA threonylcarbamoyl adenosine modification protein YeaZ
VKYLFFNTAGCAVELGASHDGGAAFYTDPDGRKASEALLPAADRLLDGLGMTVRDVDFFACVIGPGSFTGIRIGLVTARTLAQVTDKPVLPVVYTRLLSFQLETTEAESIVTLLNGWGDMCYLAVYAPGTHDALLAPAAVTYREAEAFLSSVDEPYALVTDRPARARLGRGTVYDPETCMRRLLARDRDRAVDYQTVEPLYLLESQAERDLKKKP